MTKRRPLKESESPVVLGDKLKEYQAQMRKADVLEILSLSDDDALSTVRSYISTQSIALDRLLNGRGIPCGRLTEIYGPSHIGKSTLLDHIFASVQKMGGVAILADAEGARDVEYSRRIGVNVDQLQYLEFERGQLSAENILDAMFGSAVFWRDNHPSVPVVIGWDAIGGTPTNEEIEKGAGDRTVASAAKVLRSACRKVSGVIGNTNIAVIVLNHEYTKLATGGFGVTKKETYGGEAVRHEATIRMELYSSGQIKRPDGVVVGREVTAKLTKNRLGNPWVETTVALLSGVGVDNVWTLYDHLKRTGFITVSGSWSAMNLGEDTVKFQGWAGLAEMCKSKPELFTRLVEAYWAV
jgi:recombination protein RecA